MTWREWGALALVIACVAVLELKGHGGDVSSERETKRVEEGLGTPSVTPSDGTPEGTAEDIHGPYRTVDLHVRGMT